MPLHPPGGAHLVRDEIGRLALAGPIIGMTSTTVCRPPAHWAAERAACWRRRSARTRLSARGLRTAARTSDIDQSLAEDGLERLCLRHGSAVELHIRHGRYEEVFAGRYWSGGQSISARSPSTMRNGLASGPSPTCVQKML